MTLFKTDEELQQVFPAATSGLSVTTVQPYLDDAVITHILPIVDAKQFLKLLELYESDKLSNVQKTAWAHIQSAAAKFAAISYMPFAAMQISDGGAVAVETGERRSLFKYEKAQAIEETERLAYSALNLLLLHMEQHEAVFDIWRDSPAYNVIKNSLLPNADVFSKHADIRNSRTLFFRLRVVIQRREMQLLRAAVGAKLAKVVQENVSAPSPAREIKALFDYLRTYLANRILADSMNVLQVDFVRAGLLSFAANSSDQSSELKAADPRVLQNVYDELHETSQAALADLHNYIADNQDDYPLYKIGAEMSEDNRKTFWMI
ncbi:DUF6712 family protein [Rhodoflexus caldus]|uniref:DUF6712 family protein n=1 Tax=Rhodoflexus caldus TaxID=2891236 RepID=UPI00202A709B|nr:DUF6712 family protein [Rhodoflexus caldus]